MIRRIWTKIWKIAAILFWQSSNQLKETINNSLVYIDCFLLLETAFNAQNFSWFKILMYKS